MAKRKKKTAGVGLFILGTLLVMAAAFGAYYGINNLHWGVTPPKQKPHVSVTPELAPESQRTVFLYLIQKDKKGYHLGRASVETTSEGAKLDAAMDALLATNKQGGISAGLIPEGTKLVSPVEVKRGVALVNLSKEFVDNFSGGLEQEAATVNSIAHTVVTNGDGRVRSVQILVEGKKVESLGGHFSLAEPVRADSAVLRPGSLN
jgi:spore germination protein GerM